MRTSSHFICITLFEPRRYKIAEALNRPTRSGKIAIFKNQNRRLLYGHKTAWNRPMVTVDHYEVIGNRSIRIGSDNLGWFWKAGCEGPIFSRQISVRTFEPFHLYNDQSWHANTCGQGRVFMGKPCPNPKWASPKFLGPPAVWRRPTRIRHGNTCGRGVFEHGHARFLSQGSGTPVPGKPVHFGKPKPGLSRT